MNRIFQRIRISITIGFFLVIFILPTSIYSEINDIKPIFSDQFNLDISKSLLTKINVATTDDPIYIDSDATFREVALERNWTGDGTISNPYIITNLILEDTDQQSYLIDISDTTVYFQISNCQISGGDIGIQLYNIIHGSIINSTIINCNSGIRMDSATDSAIVDNEILANNGNSIHVWDSSSIRIINNNLTNNRNGIELGNSNLCLISGNSFSGHYKVEEWLWWDGGCGLSLYSSNNNEISANYFYNNSGTAISLSDSFTNNIFENDIFNNHDTGIELHNSEDNSITNNNIFNNGRTGIYLESARYNQITGNILQNDGLEVHGWESTHFNQDEVANNTVNGKPLLYIYNELDLIISANDSVGQILLLSCINITISSHNLSNTDTGIFLAFCTTIIINKCEIKESDNFGIRSFRSIDVNIYNTNISSENEGIRFSESLQSETINNTVFNSQKGITIDWGSEFTTIKSNKIVNCTEGIVIDGAPWNIIADNEILNTTEKSIIIRYSNSNTIFNNNITGTGHGIYIEDTFSTFISNNHLQNQGLFIPHWSSHSFREIIVFNNTVNEKPLIYWIDVLGEIVPEAGEIILIDCEDLLIANQNLSFTSVGLLMQSCSNISIQNSFFMNNTEYGIYSHQTSTCSISSNNITKNQQGIFTEGGFFINISDNIVTDNKERGIFVRTPRAGEIFYHNGHSYLFIDNWINWDDAKNYCEGLGGHLVTISDNQENNFIINNFQQQYGEIWIGLSDVESEGDWQWTTGEPFTYENWDDGEPNGGYDENYAQMLWSSRWGDAAPLVNFRFVCEWDFIVSVSETVPLSVCGNIVLNNRDGVRIEECSKSLISANLIANNSFSGLEIGDSSSCEITDNQVLNNGGGIELSGSGSNIIINNTVINYGFLFDGWETAHHRQLIVENNTVNGKHLIYWLDIQDAVVPDGAGQIFLINNARVNITDQYITHTAIGVWVLDSNNINVHNNNISNSDRIGILFSQSQNCQIIQNSFIQNEDGIVIEGYQSSDNTITENSILNNSENGVRISQSPWSQISNNTISNNYRGISCYGSDFSEFINNTVINNSDQGIYIDYSLYCTLESNYVSNSSMGINIYYSQTCGIKNNFILNCNGVGLAIDSDECTLLNNTISKNFEGIRWYYSYNCVIQSNRIDKNRYNGIFLDYCMEFTILNNIISNNGGDGLSSVGEIYSTDIEDNLIVNNSLNGIELENVVDCTITRNDILNNQYHGVNLVSIDSCDITYNDIINNSRLGIILIESYASNIRYNTISENRILGIVCISIYDCVFTNNLLSKNSLTLYSRQNISEEGDFLIPTSLLFVGSSNSIVEDNQFIDNYGAAVLLHDSDNMEIKDNSISNNIYGFFFDQDSELNLVKRNDFVSNFLIKTQVNTFNSQAFDNGSDNTIVFNYWNDWVSPDDDKDGYVDIPYELDGFSNNQDPLPLASVNPPLTHRLTSPRLLYPNGGEILEKNLIIGWLPAIESFDSSVFYSIYYSSNNGKEWSLIAEDLFDNEYWWDTRYHFDSSSCLLKVVAKTPEGITEEDITDYVFSINNGNKPPPPPPPLEMRILLFLFFALSAVGILRQSRKT